MIMSNTKGNQYPLWYISNEYQVFAVDGNYQPHQMSDVNFAMEISVSEDGTVWILSTTPDPDGGGARIYWSNGDSNWNEIATSDPGGVALTGATGSNCMFMASSGEVYTLGTDGSASETFPNLEFSEIAYGGGYFWAIMPEKTGGIPVLRFMKGIDSKNAWTTVGNGMTTPHSISIGYEGSCFGVDKNSSPMSYSRKGVITSQGGGVNGITLRMGFKYWGYVITTEANKNGNLIYKWRDVGGGTYEPTTLRASRIATTYYLIQ